jgi:hypothetical protein
MSVHTLVCRGFFQAILHLTHSLLSERIASQRFAVQALIALYRHSVDMHGRAGEPGSNPSEKAEGPVPSRILRKALNGVKTVASSTTTIFGDVASEIMGR